MLTNDGFFIVLYVLVLLYIALAVKKRAKQYLLAKEAACAWLETELAFKKETLNYGSSKIFNVFYDSFSFRYLGDFLE
jgi:hypothetical protein